MIARLASEQEGVLSLEELRACGLSRSAVAARARSGRLHRLHRGVYAVGHTCLSREGEFIAAVKACGETAVLSHYSAGASWEMVVWDGRRPEVTVVTSGTRLRAGIRVHQSASLERRDVMIRNGIPVTSPARTIVDLAAILPPKALRRAVREALARQLVTVRQLAEILGRIGPRRGTRMLAQIIADGPVPTRSVLEDVVLDLILAGGFERPEINRPLVLDGRRVVPDFRWPRQKIVVEADGARWHDNPVAREGDAERQALLEAHGEHVIRVTWAQVVTKQSQTLARFEAAGAPKSCRASTP